MKTTYIMEMDDQGRITVMKELDHSGYQKGLEDAWKVAKRICAVESGGGLPADVVKKLFGNGFALVNFSAQEAIEKLEEYDKTNFRVGDVVKCCGSFGIITAVAATDGYYWMMWSNGQTEYCDTSSLKKTDCSLPGLTQILSNLKDMEDNS